ncbi:MAG: PAS domain-containing protein [Pseudomonadota bacterium]
MFKLLGSLRHSLISKLVLAVGVSLLVCISVWSFLNFRRQQVMLMENIVASSDRLGTTIKLGLHYAMALNSRDDIKQIIKNISKQPEIEHIRIYNKQGQIKFSNSDTEIDKTTNIRAEACYVCHRTTPPRVSLELDERKRILRSENGHRSLGILSPIHNEPGCSTEECHVHPADKKILGALDMSISLKGPDEEMRTSARRAYLATVLVILVTCAAIMFTILVFVRRPMTNLIAGTREIAGGEEFHPIEVDQDDEMGQLASAINNMGREIIEKQHLLNKQRDEYQGLFETVPCIITVQDRDYRLLRYNRQFADKFKPAPGDFCYHAYKGLSRKCPECPVERTFEDGLSHYSEESGFDQNGEVRHWVVTTTPIYDETGRIIAAMEMSLDITHRRKLEEELEKSEKKYYAIFNNIPNPVFVLDMESLRILDCNESVSLVYGFHKQEIIDKSFLAFFAEQEREQYFTAMRESAVINQARHLNKNGAAVFVNIRISPSEYPGQKVLLVTTSDITKRLETEQQLIQASKMATLGEMATGVAHELNQPLSVIKTAAGYFLKKVRKREAVPEEILASLSEEINSHVDRAAKIINHMREFGRKSEMDLEPVQVNHVLEKAFEIFSQQLKLREINVAWRLEENLPEILADPGRLEQVFINLLINARDAIEAQWDKAPRPEGKTIALETSLAAGRVRVRVMDNGTGIPPAISSKIFEPFFTTKDVGKGTGLGLSISYGLIQDCNGAIWTEPGQGGGAAFILEFPAAGESA